MKFLVCISKTPETTAKIAFSDNNTKYDETGVQFMMNPYDEWYALVRAIELKEQHGGSVTVIHAGPAANDVIIRKALAIGADDAVRINIENPDVYSVAENIAEQARQENYDIIFTGKETIDHNGSLIGAMIAEHLDLPFISYASRLDHDGAKARIERDVEGGVEIIEISGACVVSAAKGLAEQRIPNMRGIMMAKSKPLQIVEAKGTESLSVIASFRLPGEKTGIKMIDPDNMDELVRLLHEEVKVI